MRPNNADVSRTRLDGIVIGVVMEITSDNAPMVVFPGNLQETAVTALSTVPLSALEIGAEVALMFEGGDQSRPIILGRLLRSGEPASAGPIQAIVDGNARRLDITGREEVVLRCGKASITLTRAGKIILRGTYISSRSSGVNRIKGGSVQIN